MCAVNRSPGNDVIVFPPIHWVLQRAQTSVRFGFTPKSGQGVLHVDIRDPSGWRGWGVGGACGRGLDLVASPTYHAASLTSLRPASGQFDTINV